MRSGKISLGHPVDVATGIMFATYEDVVLPGRMRLSWSRQYSTALLSREPGLLGSGWITPYGCHLTPYAGGFQLLGPEGDLQIFEDPEGVLDQGGVLRALGSFQELAREDSHFVVTRWSANGGGALRLSFAALWPNSPLPLVSIENWNGGALDLFYDTSKRLARIEQRRERRALELEYDSSGLLTEVTILTAGGKRFVAAQYQYDERSRLAEAQAVSGHPERYAYEMGGKMVREIRRDGGVFSFEYDSAGRCVHTSGLDHYDEKTFRYHDQANWTEVTDSLGNPWRYQRKEQGQIVKSLSPCGAVTEREYDQEGRIRAITDPRGGTTEYTFDQQGDRTGIRLPDGREWKSGFNARHQFVNVTTPSGAVWTFEYDKIGRLEHVVHPAGLEWFHFWSADDLAATTNNNGAVWRYEWDEFGQMRRVATAQGTAVQRDYDELGFCTRIVDSRHGESQFEWNLAGQMVGSKNAAGLTTAMFYDGAGNLIQAGNQVTGFTRYRYGRCCGELLEEVSPSGALVRYKWSTEPGRLDSITDPNGNEHVFEYNDDGYLIRERFPSGRTLVYTRNLAGDVSEKTNGAGETTQFERDICGRVLGAAFFDGSRVEFNYQDGKLSSATNDSGTLRFERDAHGRRTKEEFGQYSIQSVYDFSGNRSTRLSNVGAHNSFNFDEHGRLRKLALSPTASLEMEYDAAGREIRRLLPGNTILSNSFDHAGRLLNQRVEHEPFLAGYKTQPHTLIDRTYKYDLIGRLSRVVDASGVFSSFSYDRAGHLETHETSSLYEVFAYDANGNISSSERHSVLPRGVGEDIQERCEIGPGDRLAQAGNRSYAYDADDRLISKTEELADGTTRQWTYEWNALGLLAAVVRPDGQRWTYTYDALGRRIRKQSEGIDIHYVWDGNAILHELDGQSVRVGTWTFSPRSFVPLAYQENEKLALPITDSLGTPREFVDETGRIVWSARYLAYGETQSLERGEIDNPVRFQGQWFDAETGLHYNNLRYYDPHLGRYLSMDPMPLAGGLNGYAYGPDPINFIDPFGLDPEYYPLDGHNRPTGAFADLSKSDLRSTGSSPPTVDPPGWQGGEHPYHQQRSHLIADTLGGSGDDPRNLVTLTDGSNHPSMSSQEAQIRNYLKNNPDGRVLLEVTAEYDGENPRPTAVRMYAINENGETIVDERIENGRRQKLKSNCCAAS